MSDGPRYATVRYPWRATVDVSRPGPALQYARIASQALRYGAPASRRPGALWAFAGRRTLPVRPVAAALRRLPSGPRPELDELREAVVAAWPQLAARSARLPAAAPEGLALLALERAASRTVFVMGDAPTPLVVLKVPRGDAAAIDHEVAALTAAAPSGIAPLPLGRVGDARAEEGLPGAPLRVEPLSARAAGRLAWTPALAGVADGLVRLAETTAGTGDWEHVRASVEAALDAPLLTPRARRALEAAWRDVGATSVAVLRHHDTSPQNCLVDGDALSGLVDWQMARLDGAPGFDVLNLASAYLEQGAGLVRWSQDVLVEIYERSLAGSAYWPAAREATRAAAAAAGMPEDRLAAVEVVFFGSRVGDRLRRPGWHGTTPQTAARILDAAVA